MRGDKLEEKDKGSGMREMWWDHDTRDKGVD
jgi:hypothetical protein